MKFFWTALFLAVVLSLSWIKLAETPPYSKQLAQCIRSLPPLSMPSGVKGIDCVYVINLKERPQRWETVKKQFDQQKITPHRVCAINGWKIPKKQSTRLLNPDSPLLKQSSGGVLGCLLSHISVYKHALEQGFETVWICEDDIEFKQNADKISLLVEELAKLDPQWDLLYTDYNTKGVNIQDPRPGQADYTPLLHPISKELVRIHGRHNTHSIIFSKRGLEKVYAYFSSTPFWSPLDVDIHYTPGLREYSTAEDLVTSIYDSSAPALDGSSDTQMFSIFNQGR